MVPLQESRPKVIRLVVTETVAGVGAVPGVAAVAAGVRATATVGVRRTMAPLQESRPKVIRLVVTETVAGVGAVPGVVAGAVMGVAVTR